MMKKAFLQAGISPNSGHTVGGEEKYAWSLTFSSKLYKLQQQLQVDTTHSSLKITLNCSGDVEEEYREI